MQEILTRTAKLSFDGKILLSELIDNVEIDLDDTMENYDAACKLTNGRPFVALSIAAPYSTITKEAREALDKQEFYTNTIAQAIVVRSLSTRILGNFIIRLNKKYCPHRLFTSREDAVKWLDYHWEKTMTKVNV